MNYRFVFAFIILSPYLSVGCLDPLQRARNNIIPAGTNAAARACSPPSWEPSIGRKERA